MKLAHFLIMGAAMITALPTLAAPLPQKTTVGMTQPRFNDLAAQCTNAVHPNTLQAVARVESGFNPYAIGVVKGRLQRQPRTLAEAVATAKSLHEQGKNFSMGLMQVNRYNLAAYGLNYETVFEPCKNINAGAKILKSCFDRAGGEGQAALQKSFSCYYSGNFRFGFKSDFKGQPPYVTKIIMSALNNSPHQTIKFSGSLKVAHMVSTPQTNYVPQPTATAQNINRQPEYIPMPASYQAPQEQVQNAPSFSDDKPVVAAVQQKPPPPEWDVFAYREYQEKYGEKAEWDAF
ncbi:lytic transglycosylase domain-containing protein [Kingella kingae]|uniref:lytic transglycosylase domain-containing protein n=3 Tax=Kingella kingae TaxID=504 RepID=UPI00030A78A4|nr:lytic transglycosylase domain-containing protein [Kingella kingae]MDK4576860.1 lytic transglycosylase domain-containing protein [Kingella kingae]MDK4582928.1 lytic transglycosylase domain-containing protein [Kingella kingae]MDK4593071.1 lytic transglycosylase domain-containing protein [Kingella kingae]MDK4595140.1 lytic transglycosylase domain-containing protein [Kingella kingae]MDK4644775.1 lytic transglycosylase domain-containing protein [Kingella kingae]